MNPLDYLAKRRNEKLTEELVAEAVEKADDNEIPNLNRMSSRLQKEHKMTKNEIARQNNDSGGSEERTDGDG